MRWEVLLHQEGGSYGQERAEPIRGAAAGVRVSALWVLAFDASCVASPDEHRTMTKMTHPDRPVDIPFLRFALNFKGRRFGNNSMTWAAIIHVAVPVALVYLWLADSWHWFAPVFLFLVLAATWAATAIQWAMMQKRAWRRWAEMLESPRGSHSYTDPDSGPGPFTQTEIGESAGGTWFGITAPWFDSPLWLTNFPGHMYGPEVLRRLNQAYDKGRKSIRP